MMMHEIKTIFFSIMSGKFIIYKTVLFILNLSFTTNAHHMFKCDSTNACYTGTEVCVKGQCVPSCVDDKSCEEGFVCHSKYKVSPSLMNYLFTIICICEM